MHCCMNETSTSNIKSILSLEKHRKPPKYKGQILDCDRVAIFGIVKNHSPIQLIHPQSWFKVKMISKTLMPRPISRSQNIPFICGGAELTVKIIPFSAIDDDVTLSSVTFIPFSAMSMCDFYLKPHKPPNCKFLYLPTKYHSIYRRKPK
jgi:hypothetical protein